MSLDEELHSFNELKAYFLHVGVQHGLRNLRMEEQCDVCEIMIEESAKRIRRADYASRKERHELFDIVIMCQREYKELTGAYLPTKINYKPEDAK